LLPLAPLMTSHVCFVGLQNLPLLAPQFAGLMTGGAEMQQTLLAKALARRGFRVSMIVADLGQSDGASWHGITTYRAYRPHAGVRVVRFAHPRWTRVWQAMRRADADVYYTSCAGALVGEVALFARRHRRKLVFKIASNSDCDPKTVHVRFPHEKWLYRYGLVRADIVLAQTELQERALLRNFSRESRVVPPLADVAATRREFRDRDIDVLWIGNLRKLKRPELLLQAARALPDLKFHMVGGPMAHAEDYFEEVRRQASDVPNVTFHGHVPYEETKGFYERARMLVGTSEIEGFPNTYLQAWAHGAPVVAYLDPESLIVSHGLGRQVQDANALHHSIALLATNEGEWSEASARCVRFFDERFDEDAMLRPYVDALCR
jgi:glycosyltransferase involved in cell wall biosynthesis